MSSSMATRSSFVSSAMPVRKRPWERREGGREGGKGRRKVVREGREKDYDGGREIMREVGRGITREGGREGGSHTCRS